MKCINTHYRMIFVLLLSVLSTTYVTATDNGRLISFPGAEGFGRYTTGGRAIDSRGSNVYYVTSLEDDGSEGTLRWALSTGDATPRTILFNVCGTINLKSVLRFSYPNVTIAGQSAPGGGICISGAKMYANKDNVIIRYIRFRAGDHATSSYPSIDVENINHCIIDHCSFTWSMEENMTMYDNDSTTVQWCIIGEGLYNSKNIKGARAYASQWGGEHSTFHHNLITNCFSRTPRLNGVRDDGSVVGAHDQFVDEEIINNVIYNWAKSNSCYGGENSAPNISGAYDRVYMINNYYKPGPTTYYKLSSNRYFAEASYNKKTGTTGQWLLTGNMFEFNDGASTKSIWQKSSLDAVNADNVYGTASGASDRSFNISEGNNATNVAAYTLASQPVSSGVTTHDAYTAYQKVVAMDGNGAGAQLPRIDEEDARLIKEAAGIISPVYYGSITNDSKMLGIIDSQTDIKLSKEDPNNPGWPYLGLNDGETTIVDTDKDGMPDAYETLRGFNPNDSSDGSVISSNGYSNLENYLNAVADGSYSPITGIKSAGSNDLAIKSIRYYNTNGVEIYQPSNNLNIIKYTYSDGTIRTNKVLQNK